MVQGQVGDCQGWENGIGLYSCGFGNIHENVQFPFPQKRATVWHAFKNTGGKVVPFGML